MISDATTARTWVVRVDFPSGRRNYHIDARDEAGARKQIEEHLNAAGLPPTGIVEVLPA